MAGRVLTHHIIHIHALTPGTRLGVYQITAQIGEGGMGQVYRAKAGVPNLYWENADGTGDVTRLTDSPVKRGAEGSL